MSFSLSLWCPILRSSGCGAAIILALAASGASAQVRLEPERHLPTVTAPPGTLRTVTGEGVRPISPQNLAIVYTQAASTLGLSLAGASLQITSIAPSSPLQSLGLRPGDIISGINGRPILNAQQLLQTLTSLGSSGTDTSASITVSRNGALQTLNVSNDILQKVVQAQTGGTAATTSTGTATTTTTGTTTTGTNATATNATGTNATGTNATGTNATDTNASTAGNAGVVRTVGAPATTSAANVIGQSLAQPARTTATTSAAGSSTTSATGSGSSTEIRQTSTGLIAPNAGILPPAGTITPPTIDPSRLPPGSGGTENTTSASAATTQNAPSAISSFIAPQPGTTTTPAPANTTDSTSGIAISRTGTGLIAPNAGIAPPVGTVTPPTIDPSRLPPGSGGTENTTNSAAPAAGFIAPAPAPTSPVPASTADGTSGIAISRTDTGLIAPNAGIAPPVGTVTPPTIDPSRLPPGSGGSDNTTTGASSASQQSAALPTTILTGSGPRIVLPAAPGIGPQRAGGAAGVGVAGGANGNADPARPGTVARPPRPVGQPGAVRAGGATGGRPGGAAAIRAAGGGGGGVSRSAGAGGS